MRGILVAFEGIDGVGKHTQAKLLCDRTRGQGLSTTEFSFPRYGQNAFSRAVARYLNGEFGSADEVAPEFAGLLYAGDRFAALEELERALSQHDLVLCDRYVPSNLAHQGAKVNGKHQEEVIGWLAEIEFGVFRLPFPDLTVLLDMPVTLAAEQVGRKLKRTYTDRKADIHEEDLHYLSRCQRVFRSLTESQIGKMVIVHCADEQGVRSPTAIADEVWRHVDVALNASVQKSSR